MRKPNIAILGATGALKGCNFLLEGTKYADSTKSNYGPLLENTSSSNSTYIWRTYAVNRGLNNYYANNTDSDIRPVIDVPMSRIEY